MTTRVETTRIDYDRDGLTDDLTTVTYEFTGDKLTKLTSVLEDLNGGGRLENVTEYSYDATGNNVGEIHYGNNWGTTLEFTQAVERQFDSSGHVTTESSKSPDFDGNGVLDDYVAITNYLYDSAGRMTFLRTDNTAYGGQAQSDYHEETWKYDSQGRLTEYRIDDPITFDCEITRTYNYKNGVLQNIKEQNPIRFADYSDPDRAHIVESFTWNKDGSMKTKTEWGDHNGQRTDHAYTWKAGYDSEKISYDAQGDFKPEGIDLIENWYNKDGHLTHTLTSHDFGGDGGNLAGGFDSRDLFVKVWDGDTMVHETRDYGNDGVIDYDFTSQLLVA